MRTPISIQPGPATPVLTTHFEPYVSVEKAAEYIEQAYAAKGGDKAAFGGTAEIALVFDPESFALKQWTLIDAQGFQTVVSLFNIHLVTKPDPALFHIDDTTGTGGGPRRH